jgi:hypothetical protein
LDESEFLKKIGAKQSSSRRLVDTTGGRCQRALRQSVDTWGAKSFVASVDQGYGASPAAECPFRRVKLTSSFILRGVTLSHRLAELSARSQGLGLFAGRGSSLACELSSEIS